MAKEVIFTLKLKGDAGSHDAWFSAEIEQALREADDPDVTRISQSAAASGWRRQRAALVKRTIKPEA